MPMEKLYTAGELAKIAGVSSRTIRYYDEKGILKPCGYSGGEYRLYDEKAVITLQQILMLKYVGFSLDEIKDCILQEEIFSLKERLERQKTLMLQKRMQMDKILYVLEESIDDCQMNSPDLQHFTNIMNLLTKNEFATQRYHVYEKYNTRQQEWFEWRVDCLGLKENMQILDVGCGHGVLWCMNWMRIPAGCKIVLLDKAKKGLDYFRKYYEMNRKDLAPGVEFQIIQADAEVWEYPADTYDCILTNHFWDYIEEKELLMHRLYQALKSGGVLASTIPNILNMEDLIPVFGEMISEEEIQEFVSGKEQSKLQLVKLFKSVFELVEQKIFINHLDITRAEDGYTFFQAENSKIKQVMERQSVECLNRINELIKQSGYLRVEVAGPMFLCTK